jgi:hypothetical protein
MDGRVRDRDTLHFIGARRCAKWRHPLKNNWISRENFSRPAHAAAAATATARFVLKGRACSYSELEPACYSSGPSAAACVMSIEVVSVRKKMTLLKFLRPACLYAHFLLFFIANASEVVNDWFWVPEYPSACSGLTSELYRMQRQCD